jgi:hypothetical protein
MDYVIVDMVSWLPGPVQMMCGLRHSRYGVIVTLPGPDDVWIASFILHPDSA